MTADRSAVVGAWGRNSPRTPAAGGRVGSALGGAGGMKGGGSFWRKHAFVAAAKVLAGAQRKCIKTEGE